MIIISLKTVSHSGYELSDFDLVSMFIDLDLGRVLIATRKSNSVIANPQGHLEVILCPG